jgi:uncharacterized protein YcfJ
MTDTNDTIVTWGTATAVAEREQPGEPDEDGLVLGRPIEDRSFEAVEAGAGMLAGMVVGTAVAGPVGTAVGALVGAAAGLAAGEALERHEGRAAHTTDATED